MDFMSKNFDWEKPTVQMLGRWQPWHDGHQELFKRIHAITGQVCIMVRKVPAATEANERVPGQDDNPFGIEEVKKAIPHTVYENNEGYLSMSDRGVLAHMHKAIIELEERLSIIEQKIK